MFELIENKRQCKHPDYALMLNRFRIGEFTTCDIKVLQTRLFPSTEIPQDILHISALKDDRDSHNELRVKHISANNHIHVIHALHDVEERFIPKDDQKCAGIPRTIMLCNNARVMLIRNIDTQNGLVNGAQRTFHSIEWEQHNNDMPRCVNVIFDNAETFKQFDQNTGQPIGICPLTVRFLGNDHRYISRTQIPLILSFTTTIHKVQGLTLSNAVCDLGQKIFTGGMAYVALSRVQTLHDLYLTNLCPPRIYPCKNFTVEMNRLREKSNP